MDKIAIIGLGYVGLPLAHAFSSKYQVTGFDTSEKRIQELEQGYDRTLELNQAQIQEARANRMIFTCDPEAIRDCTVYIVTVPTPVDGHKQPDLTPLLRASGTVGKVLKKNDIVIYESTVYPGATEEDCVPVLEKFSGLKFNSDFFCGYSPERINPGDKQHTVTEIIKVTSGSTPSTGEKVDALYRSVITAGTHLTPSIKVAEAAKVIENSQRDINIAFINELTIIFNKLGIDTQAVLKAAATKWNFLKFQPGLIGGHCIGVDPYYLAYKSQEMGYLPEILLAGRRLNDNMGIYVAQQVIKLMIKKDHKVRGSRVLVLGITFKENCPDIRNSRVIDVIREMEEYGCQVEVSDYWANPTEVRSEYGVELIKNPVYEDYQAIVVAVAHTRYQELLFNNPQQVVYDVKGILANSDGRL